MNLMLTVNIFPLSVLKTQEEKRLSVIRDLSSSPARA